MACETAVTGGFYAGTAGAADQITTVPAGSTCTWDKYDAANYGWLIAKTDEQIETSFADIENALALSDNVVVTDAANITAGHYLATAANIKGATITFKAGLTVNEDVTVPEDSAFIIEGNLAIDGDDTLTVNGEVEVSGTLSGNSSMAGTGKVTANEVSATSFAAPAAGATLKLVLQTETDTVVNASEWSIGGYTGNAVKAPAGTYVANNSLWTLTETVTEIEATTLADDTMLSQLFSVTNQVVAASVTAGESVNVTNEKTLVLTGNTGSSARVYIAAQGTVELRGNIAWNLGNFVGVGAGATIEFTGSLATNPINNGVTQTFYADGVVVITYTQIANSTFEFDLNAAGTGNSGFVKQ